MRKNTLKRTLRTAVQNAAAVFFGAVGTAMMGGDWDTTMLIGAGIGAGGAFFSTLQNWWDNRGKSPDDPVEE